MAQHEYVPSSGLGQTHARGIHYLQHTSQCFSLKLCRTPHFLRFYEELIIFVSLNHFAFKLMEKN